MVSDVSIVGDLQPERNDEDNSQQNVNDEEDVVTLSSEDVDRGSDHQRHREDSLRMSACVILVASGKNLR